MSFLKKYPNTIITVLGISFAILAIILELSNTGTNYLMIIYIFIIICFGTIFIKNKSRKKD